jgi:starvation-inducible DNA-binding protein
MAYPHTTPHDVDREVVGVELQRVLVTLVDLSLIGQHAYWNVVGPSFRSLQLGLMTDAWRRAADAVGEQIAALGGSPDGRAETVAARSELPTLSDGPQPHRELVASLTAILTGAIQLIGARLRRIEDLDPVNADLLRAVVATLEEQLWMIRGQAG